MPLLSPSRIAVFVLSMSLITFLWTFGLPHQLARSQFERQRPIGGLSGQQNGVEAGKVLTEPLVPGPLIEDKTKATSTPTIAFATATEAEAKTDVLEKPGERPTTLRTAASLAASSVGESNENGSKEASAVASTVPSPDATDCKQVPGAANVMVIVKTSKAELNERLPTHLSSLLSCVPNFAIFSDHAGEIDGHTVHDALEGALSNTTLETHNEFREYETMQANRDYQPDAAKIKELDKWKMLPMVYKAYKMNPDARFYFFIEGDTSLSWTNLLQWMDRLDYRIPYYSGAPTFLAHTKFAQRGAGIFLSQGALRRYRITYDERYDFLWEPRVSKECCGDLVLSTAMNDAHVEFYSAWPLLQGETPTSLDYTKRHWCAPIVSWHHMSTDEINMIWDFQTNWTATHGWSEPYLVRDVFAHFIMPHLTEMKTEWDNLSQDNKIAAPAGRKQKLQQENEQQQQQKSSNTQVKHSTSQPEPSTAKKRTVALSPRNDNDEAPIQWDKIAETVQDAADSAASCRAVCEKLEDCLQWRFTPSIGDGECHLSKVIRLGRKAAKGDAGATTTTTEWTSGWMLERIEKAREEWECSAGPSWKFNQ